jgi:hypothetical protein
MKLLPLLGKSLKDEDVIDILEAMKLEVIYDFDRSHEGLPDNYWASAHENGMQFRFDEAQNLATIFLYIVPEDGFAGCAQNYTDIPVFSSEAEVQVFGESHRLEIKTGRADFFGRVSDWVRLGFGAYFLHYEFRSGSLAIVTVMRNTDWVERP